MKCRKYAHPLACLWLLIIVVGCTEKRIDKVNFYPKAIAGDDQFIFLPANELILDGSKSNHPDGNIASYQWKKIDGFGQANIDNANARTTRAYNLQRGKYWFELEVSDTKGKKGRDTVIVQVADQILNSNSVIVSNLVWQCPFGCGATIENISRLLPPQKKLVAAYYRYQRFAPWHLVYSNLGKVNSLIEAFFDHDSLLLFDPDEKGDSTEGQIALVYQ